MLIVVVIIVGPNLEATQSLLAGESLKELYNIMLLSNKEEWTATWDNMNESQKCCRVKEVRNKTVHSALLRVRLSLSFTYFKQSIYFCKIDLNLSFLLNKMEIVMLASLSWRDSYEDEMK